METQQPTQQQQQPVPRPRLERLRSDRVVAGVASGFARHLGIDPAWVRIGFVVVSLFGGAGVLAYLISWIAIPEEGESDSVLTTKARTNPNWGSWVGIGLIVLAALILVGNTGLVDGEVVFAGGLIALGVLLYRGDIGGRTDTTDVPEESITTVPAPPTPPPPVVAPVVEPVAEPTASGIADEPVAFGEPPAPPPAAAFQPRPPRPRERSALGRLALATLMIVIGVMGVGDSAGWWDPLARHYAGAFLVTLGGALLVGTIFGRARWLIAIGFVSAPFLFAGAILDVPLDGGFGEPVYAPTTAKELRSEYRLVGGDMTLDLSDIELESDQVFQIDASVVFGRLEVRVPDGVGVNVSAEVDGGEIRIDGDITGEGINVDSEEIYEGTGMIDLDLHVGFGELNVLEVERLP